MLVKPFICKTTCAVASAIRKSAYSIGSNNRSETTKLFGSSVHIVTTDVSKLKPIKSVNVVNLLRDKVLYVIVVHRIMRM